MKVSGTVWYDAQTLHADGTIRSLIGNVSKPLMIGAINIPVGNTATSSVNERGSSPANTLDLAGLDLTVNRLALSSFGGGRIELSGKVKMPTELGSLSVVIPATAPLVIDSNGVRLSGVLAVPALTVKLGGIQVKPQLQAQYISARNALQLTGAVIANKLFKWTLNVPLALPSDQFVEIRNGHLADAVIHLSVNKILIKKDKWELRDVTVDIDTVANTASGAATVLFVPKSFSVRGLLGIRNGRIDSLGATVQGMNIPLGAYAELRGAGFRITDWSTPDLTMSIQDVTISSTKRWDYDLDSLNLHFHGAVLEIVGSGTLSQDGFTTTGVVSALGGLIHGSTTIDFFWDPGYFSFAVSDSAIAGIVKTGSKWKVTQDLNFVVGGSAKLSLPDSWIETIFGSWIDKVFKTRTMRKASRKALTSLLGVPKVGCQFVLNVITDNNKSNDFLAVWLNVPWPLSIKSEKAGFKFGFGGTISVLLDRDINKLPTS